MSTRVFSLSTRVFSLNTRHYLSCGVVSVLVRQFWRFNVLSFLWLYVAMSGLNLPAVEFLNSLDRLYCLPLEPSYRACLRSRAFQFPKEEFQLYGFNSSFPIKPLRD